MSSKYLQTRVLYDKYTTRKIHTDETASGAALVLEVFLDCSLFVIFLRMRELPETREAVNTSRRFAKRKEEKSRKPLGSGQTETRVWRIFNIPTSENIDDVISTGVPLRSLCIR